MEAVNKMEGCFSLVPPGKQVTWTRRRLRRLSAWIEKQNGVEKIQWAAVPSSFRVKINLYYLHY